MHKEINREEAARLSVAVAEIRNGAEAYSIAGNQAQRIRALRSWWETTDRHRPDIERWALDMGIDAVCFGWWCDALKKAVDQKGDTEMLLVRSGAWKVLDELVRASRTPSDHEDYKTAKWFKQQTGIDPARLRMAAKRGDLPKRGTGRRTQYHVPTSQQLWPEDFEGISRNRT